MFPNRIRSSGRPKAFALLFLLALLSWVYPCPDAGAVVGEISFDPSPDSRVVGYKLYYGRSVESFDHVVDLGAETSHTIYDLAHGTPYYFAASAYDQEGNESDLSEILMVVTPDCLQVEPLDPGVDVPIVGSQSPPTADAGPDQTVTEGSVVRISGLNSTHPDNGPIGFLWEQVDGPEVTLSDPEAAEITFTAPAAGPEGVSLSFRLTVMDGSGLMSDDYCVVNVAWVNRPPTADAGPDQNVEKGFTVTLSGGDSWDPDDGIARYLWEQTGGPTVILSDPTDPEPTFTAPDVTDNDMSMTFRLTVEDFGGLRSTDTCVVNVLWMNAPPVADAGPDQVVIPRTLITLDGSQSHDDDDAIVAVRWTQIGGPPVVLLDPTSIRTTFVARKPRGAAERYVFRLTVTDEGGLTAQDSCTVTVAHRNRLFPRKPWWVI